MPRAGGKAQPLLPDAAVVRACEYLRAGEGLLRLIGAQRRGFWGICAGGDRKKHTVAGAQTGKGTRGVRRSRALRALRSERARPGAHAEEAAPRRASKAYLRPAALPKPL